MGPGVVRVCLQTVFISTCMLSEIKNGKGNILNQITFVSIENLVILGSNNTKINLKYKVLKFSNILAG